MRCTRSELREIPWCEPILFRGSRVFGKRTWPRYVLHTHIRANSIWPKNARKRFLPNLPQTIAEILAAVFSHKEIVRIHIRWPNKLFGDTKRILSLFYTIVSRIRIKQFDQRKHPSPKKLDSPLCPILATIQKSGLYGFIRMAYSQPPWELVEVNTPSLRGWTFCTTAGWSLCRGLLPSYQTALQLGSCKRAGYSSSRPLSRYDRLLKAFLPDQTGLESCMHSPSYCCPCLSSVNFQLW